jgi:hypothetical protein
MKNENRYPVTDDAGGFPSLDLSPHIRGKSFQGGREGAVFDIPKGMARFIFSQQASLCKHFA